MDRAREPDLFRSVLVITILGILIAFSLWILRPFLPALIWATMIAVATWPMMLAVQARLWRRRWLAVLVMTITLLLVFVVPFSLAIGTLVAHAGDITNWVKTLDVHALDAPPQWVAKLPMIGESVDSAWREVVAAGDLGGKIAPYTGDLLSWFVAQIGGLGAVVLQFLMTVAATALLYAKGETAAGGVLSCARKIGGARGESVVVLAGQAIRGVAMGVVVTAVVQSVMGGIGLAIVGVPYAAVLTAVMFMLSVAQIGASPVLACAVIWLFWKGDTGWAVGLLVWTIIVGSLDNILRPILIKRGADLPVLLILVGVIGGLIAFGLVGIFIGPIVLAVSYTLIAAWVDEPASARDGSARP
ncbi:MAG TPA: AI-2E family transporter YdiK [Planctomycetota bacterium]|nr:AI-2E family transporter YdiK [Planctomycetota bacterium]